MTKNDVATCRGCGMVLKGKPYYMGGSAYHPKTNEQCKTNHYGGFVCSYDCDKNSSIRLERTMPGHNREQKNISCFAKESLERNWS